MTSVTTPVAATMMALNRSATRVMPKGAIQSPCCTAWMPPVAIRSRSTMETVK